MNQINEIWWWWFFCGREERKPARPNDQLNTKELVMVLMGGGQTRLYLPSLFLVFVLVILCFIFFFSCSDERSKLEGGNGRRRREGVKSKEERIIPSKSREDDAPK